MVRRALFALHTASACITVSALALASGAPQPTSRSDFDAALVSWRAIHGPAWQADYEPTTGRASFLYGGHAAAPFLPRDEADVERAARAQLASTRGLHGVDPATLLADRIVFLPLGQIGSSDKWTVRYVQRAGAVEVEDASVNVLLDVEGRLLSVQALALTDLAGSSSTPALSAARAAERAIEVFRGETGEAPNVVGEPRLRVIQVQDGKRRAGRLAWTVDVQSIVEGARPAGYVYAVDASDGRVLRKRPSIHFLDVGGQVMSHATPGLLPDTAANPATLQPMPHLSVSSSAGTTTTDAAGNFVFPGVSGPLDVTVAYTGPFNTVVDAAGPAFSLTQTLPAGTGSLVTMNPGPQDLVTAQANAFHHVGRLRDWIRSVLPTDATADFQATSRVNINQACNAYYDGSSINFFLPGSPCPNTAYSSVIAHEHGHWLNDRYGTLNGGDGMGEGNADVFAMYLYDSPWIGLDFAGPGTAVRSGLNTRMFCGDTNPACYGGVHADGEPWMGAAWKVRARLNTTHGNVPGDLIADSLFLGWLNAYDQYTIQSVIETQWLVLDDDDGNLGNVTPHFADIDQGFQAQGFPAFVPPVIQFSGVVEVQDSACDAGTYPVTAAITSQIGVAILGADVVYTVSGQVPSAVPMVAGPGASYTGVIPAAGSPLHVSYYLQATDALGNTRTFPAGAPAETLGFHVGVPVVLVAESFEGPGDGGWTHGTVAGAGNPNDDWQRGTPAGLSGNAFGVAWSDPAAAALGTACWGNDLGFPGANGAYQADVHNFLRAPLVDCTGSVGTTLRYKRWLTVEESIYDRASVVVNGVEVWRNASVGNLVDSGWVEVEHDISAVADGNAAVDIRFALASDAALELGGWQIDALEVVTHTTAPPCCPPPAPYCVASPNSAGPGAHVQALGGTSVAQNGLVLQASGGPPARNGFFFFGAGQTQTSFGNGVQCIGGTMFKLPVLAFDAAGLASQPLDLANLPAGSAIQPGEDWSFQMLYRDPSAGGAGFNLSDGVRVHFCP